MSLNSSGPISFGGNIPGQSIELEYYGTTNAKLDMRAITTAFGGTPGTPFQLTQMHGQSGVLILAPVSSTLAFAITYSAYSPVITFTTTIKTGKTATPPYTYVVITGNIPTGMTLTTAGVLSGTPTTTGVFAFIVSSTDTKGVSTANSYTINVTAVPQFIVTKTNTYYLGYVRSATTSTTFSTNQTNTQTTVYPILVTGGTTPYTFTSTSSTVFPSLLTLNSTTGAVTITGSSVAISNFTTAKTINISMTDSTPSPYQYSASSSSITIQAAQFVTATPVAIVILYATPSSTTTNYPASTFSSGGTTTVAGTTGVSSFTSVSGGIGGVAALTYAVSSSTPLPAGLSINTSTGLITSTSAIPVSNYNLTSLQTYNVTITDPVTTFNITTSFTMIAVSQLNPVVIPVIYLIYNYGTTASTSFSNNQTVTTPSINPVSIVGGTSPYTYTLTGTLTGLIFNTSTGTLTISGASVAISNYVTQKTFTISMVDSTQPNALTYASSTLTMQAAQAIIATPVPIIMVYPSGNTTTNTFSGGGIMTITGTTGVHPFTSVSGGIGGAAVLTYTVTGLPSGLSLSTAGLLTATGATVSGLVTAQTYNTSITDSVTGFQLQTSFQLIAVQQLLVTSNTTTYVTYTYGSTILTGFSTNQTTITSTVGTLTVTGGTSPYVFSSTNLPSAFILNSSTGFITLNTGATNTGITTQQTYNVTVVDSTSILNLTYTNSALTIQAVQLITATPHNIVLIYTSPATTTTTFSGGGTTIITGATGVNPVTSVSGGLGTLSYAITGTALPSGLSLNSTTGLLTATSAVTVAPLAIAQTYNIKITDSTTTFSYSTTFTIRAVAQLAVTTQNIYLLYAFGATTSTTFINSQTSAYPIATTSYGTSPYIYSSSNLTAGLTLNATTGAITINSGSVAISGFTSQQTFAITVTDSTAPSALTLTSSSLHVQAVQAIVATPVAIIMTYTGVTTTTFLNGTNAFTGVSGGLGTLSYAITGTALPSGLSLSATGVLSSTGVTVSGLLSPQTYNVTITDPTTSITLSTSFSVQAVPLFTATVNTPSSNVYLVYQYGATTATSFAPNQTSTITPVTVTGGTGALTYTFSSSLSSNISINSSTGALSITTPITVAGYTTQTYTISVHDSTSTQQSYTTPTWNFTSMVQAIHVTPVNIIMYYIGVTTSTFAGSGGTQILGSTGVSPFSNPSGGLGTLSYVVTGLPTGLSLSTAGLLTSTGVTASSITTQQTYNATITDPTTGISLATSFNLLAVSQLQVTPKNIYIIYTSGATTATTFTNSATSAYPFIVTGGYGTLTYSSTTLPSAFTLNTTTGAITINGGSVAIAAYTSGVTFTLTVTDQTQSPYTQTYTNSTITIQAVQVLAATNYSTTLNLANGIAIPNLAGKSPTYTGGLAPITYVCPALTTLGLTYTASGGSATLSGTPNTESTWNSGTSLYNVTTYTINITDSIGQIAPVTVPIFVSVKPGQKVQTSGSGTWNVPNAVSIISSVAIGGGGGGGGGSYAIYSAQSSGAATAGAGGGGGGLTYISSFSIPAGTTSFTLTAGAGGSAGTDKYSGVNSNSTSGTAGGNSTIVYSSTTVMTASGGSGGQSSTATAYSTVTVSGTGGGGGGGGGGSGSCTVSYSGGSGGSVNSSTSQATAAGVSFGYGGGGGGGAAGYAGNGASGANASTYTYYKTVGYPYTIYQANAGTAGNGTSGVGAGGGGGGSSPGYSGVAGSNWNTGGSGGNMTTQPYSTSVTGTAGAAGAASTYTSSSNTNYPGGAGGTISGVAGSNYGGGGGGRQSGTGGVVRIIWGTQTANGIAPVVSITRQYPYTNIQDY
jgi:hypothetical protein